MTNRPTPWDDIQKPDADYNVRRLPAADGPALYWGRDSEGRCLFILELNGDHAAQFQQNRVSVHGIRIEMRLLDASRIQGLVLTLEQQVDRDLFLGLCQTLAASVAGEADPSVALSIALIHLKRWKAFMAGRKSRLLTPEELRGLFAELLFLRAMYRTNTDHAAAVQSWCGPEGLHQDFVFADRAVEIKAVSGRERSAVRISSEDQLETACERLFLMIYRLSEMPDSEQAISLNQLVQLVESEIQDAAAREDLSAKLAACGYVELREYDTPRLLVTGQRAYRVLDDFPRLVRSGLPQGIARVGYEIEFESMARFECEPDTVWSD
ncbi:MAG: PD-(D/E)XK motif protein [Bryobacterales bacterium]